jgi:hypothetical protein
VVDLTPLPRQGDFVLRATFNLTACQRVALLLIKRVEHKLDRLALPWRKHAHNR